MFYNTKENNNIIILSLLSICIMFASLFGSNTPALAQGGTSCAHVFSTESTITKSYCPATTPVGTTCKNDHPNVPSGKTCTNSVSNPIQAAIDYDKTINGYKVALDSGTFEINDYQDVAFNWRIGIHVPSYVWLEGTKDGAGNPISIIKPSSTVPTTRTLSDGTVTPFYDVMVLVFGDSANANTAVTNTTINSVQIDGNYRSNIGLQAGKAQGGMSFYWLKVKNTKSSGIVLGTFNQHENGGNGSGKIYEFNGTANNHNIIHACQVENVKGDGLALMGEYNTIEYCYIKDATEDVSNGITLFSGSQHVIIQNNTIENTRTGIGLDGSFLAYCPAGHACKDYEKIEDFNNFNAEQGIGKMDGYNKWITVQNNTINVPGSIPSGKLTYGIALWRNYGTVVQNNTINGNSNHFGVGIHLNESDSNYVAGNNASSLDIGVLLDSEGFSRSSNNNSVGTSYNGIGLTTFGNWGNTLTNNKVGIKLQKVGGTNVHIQQNTIANNNLQNYQIAACDYSESDSGSGRQYAYSNLGGNCNHPNNPYTQ